jgi:hypothetical protein
MMIFDEAKVWRAMNAIEAAAALGFNDMVLCDSDKAHISDYLKKRALEQAELRERFPGFYVAASA